MIAAELYEKAREHYELHKKELKLRHSIRSLSAFIVYCIREYMKEKEII